MLDFNLSQNKDITGAVLALTVWSLPKSHYYSGHNFTQHKGTLQANINDPQQLDRVIHTEHHVKVEIALGSLARST